MAHAVRKVELLKLVLPAQGGWARLPAIAGVAGLALLALSYLLGRGTPRELLASYLVAFLFCVSIGLGALFQVLVLFATKAGWGIVVRRLAEATAAALPVLLLLFVPIYFGRHELYHWSHADAAAHDEILRGKSAYLNSGFFLLRTVLYFTIWTALSQFFLRTSSRQDKTGEPNLTRRMIVVSAPGLLLFALSVTFAAFDWIMSLEPHWYSTIYGVYFFAGSLVGAFAFLILLSAALERSGPLAGVVTTEHFHDQGKLLFAFTVFWTYIAFSQYFLIWYANIPEETVWFLARNHGSWRQASIALALGHFALPFLFLMSRHIKRRRPLLVAGASWMLFMHFYDLHWQVMPTHRPEGFALRSFDVTTLLGVAGVFLATVTLLLRRRALVPIRDPRLVESLSFENV